MSVESGCHVVLLLEPQKSFQSSIWVSLDFQFYCSTASEIRATSQRDMSAELVRYQCHVQAQKVGRRFDLESRDGREAEEYGWGSKEFQGS